MDEGEAFEVCAGGAVEGVDLGTAMDIVGFFGELLEERWEHVVFEGLFVGSDDVGGGERGSGVAVAVGLADFVGIFFEGSGNFLNGVFNGGDALGTAEAAEGGVGGEVSFTDSAGDADVG